MATPEQFQNWYDEYTGSNWPLAVPPSMIVTTDQQKWIRANSICKYYLKNIAGKTFLDFGCGAGHVTIAASQQAAKSIGYDIEDRFVDDYGSEYDQSKFLCTTDWKQVANNSKYDIVMLYDVLDHIKPDRVEAALRTVASACRPDTDVYVRCHPWTSPHGGHVYNHINRAFAHFFMDQDRLDKYQDEYVNQITKPMFTYRKWFYDYGFEIIKSDKILYPWDANKNSELFKGDKAKHLDNSNMSGPGWQTAVFSIEFVDFVLRIK